MQFLYGNERHPLLDVTADLLRTCRWGGKVVIPAGDDARVKIFGDPAPGEAKAIFVCNAVGQVTQVIRAEAYAIADHPFEGPDASFNPALVQAFKRQEPPGATANDVVTWLHERLFLAGGIFAEEFQEQVMSAAFVRPTARVLELGANIGRNSLVISYMLDDSRHLVALDSNPAAIPLLNANRVRNGLGFHIVNAALSKRRIFQRGWETVPDAPPGPNYREVRTVTFQELEDRYFRFDTLVVDCEGALYYILKDSDEILSNIKCIIQENDYADVGHYEFVRATIERYGFRNALRAEGGWGPCREFFYEVWVRER